MKIFSVNPATETVNKEFETFPKERVYSIGRTVKKSFSPWRKIGIKKRCGFLENLSEVLVKNKEKYSSLITLEMGKPIKQSLAEIEKCALAARIYAQNAQAWLRDEIVPTESKRSFVRFEPLGTILCIMPWNFPFWQVFRFAIPSLAAGNVVLLRHSNTVPICALAIEEVFKEAGFPPDVFRTVLTDYNLIAQLIGSDLIDGVSFTGSVGAGKKIGQLAGRHIKKFVLELGGSDPFIVLEDADINLACRCAVESRILNSGQSCIAAKRFIVVKKVSGMFAEGLIRSIRRMKVGNPLDMDTDIGPLASKQQIKILESQIRDAVGKGSKIECGGKKVSGTGYFWEPTVLTQVKKTMKVVRDEVFGPVAPVIVAENEVQAIREANDTEFGLGASIWTDQKRGEKLADQLEAGVVCVNKVVRSNPLMPFGGTKKSGIGRELGSFGIKEFTNIKSITVG